MTLDEWLVERNELVNSARRLRAEALDDMIANRQQHALARSVLALVTLALAHERPEDGR